MPLTWTHRREVGQISAACRTAGAEGRFFPILCADPGLRRTFESALKEAGGFELKLEKIPAAGSPGGPWPEALREHRGDHYNRVLWCLDFAPDDPSWLEEAEARREQAQKPGTWVMVWLRTPTMQRRMESMSPALWGERTAAPTLFTPDLLTPTEGLVPNRDLAATLTAEGAALAKSGDPSGAVG